MENQSVAPDAGSLYRLIRSPVLWFGLLACGITWSVGIPDALARFGFCERPVSAWAYYVALLGPAVAAIIVASTVEGVAGLKRLAATLRPRGPLRWYLFALLAPLGSLGLVMALLAPVNGVFPSGHAWLIALRQTVVLTPLFLREELGWRSFLLPHLMRSRSPLRATALITLLSVLWHAPAYVAHTTVLYSLLMGAAIFPISWQFTLIFLRTRSVLPCLLFHSAIDCGFAILVFGPLQQNYAPALALWVGLLWLMVISLRSGFSAGAS